jgi:hypothetical protein
MMSDVHNAPAAAPPAAAPAEAVINPNPVSTPAPVGPQAPPKPAGDIAGSPHRPESRRETIQKAFARAPGMGHNNPPEPMAKERQPPDRSRGQAEPKTAKSEPPPKIDLKKRPEQPREHGRFAAAPRPPGSTDDPPEARQPQPGARPQSPRPAVAPLPTHAPYHEPPDPRRWDQQARADWSTTPESVRGAVHRMHKEFAGAYQAMAADKKTMDSIRHFEHMARQQGTTLDRALTNYTGIEQQLRADPIAGLSTIVNNLNLRTSDGRQLQLRDIVHYLATQSPEGHQALQTRTQQTAQQHQMGQLLAGYNQLAQAIQLMQYRQQFRQTRRQVDRFAETHPRLEELADDIQRELRFGYRLPQAYQRAELLRPATHAAQTRTASAQTRHTDRSISGAPSGAPANGAGRPRKASASPRDAVANALKRVNGTI